MAIFSVLAVTRFPNKTSTSCTYTFEQLYVCAEDGQEAIKLLKEEKINKKRMTHIDHIFVGQLSLGNIVYSGKVQDTVTEEDFLRWVEIQTNPSCYDGEKEPANYIQIK